jgi:Domain of unknown function (DUF4160)
VPEISRFLGVIITMYYDDHAPPHFHARYGDRRALVDIESLSLLSGSLPPRVRGFVTEWAAMHQEELRRNWELARRKQPLFPIAPLE